MTTAWVLAGVLLALLGCMLVASAKLGAIARQLDAAEPDEGALEPAPALERAPEATLINLDHARGLENSPMAEPPPVELSPVSLVVYGKLGKIYVQRLGEPELMGDGAYVYRRLDTGEKLEWPAARELEELLEQQLARRHRSLFDVRYNGERHEFR